MSDNNNPVTREEIYLSAAAGNDTELPEPITRKELFLAKAAGADVQTPEPITREEMFLSRIAGGGSGGGGSISLQDKTITENGTYTADAGYDGLGKVTVDVAGSGGIAAGISYDEFDSSGNLTKATVYGDKVLKYALQNHGELRSVTLPDNCQLIANDAFSQCPKLELTSLPEGVTIIGARAFSGNRALALTSLPESLTSLGESSFNTCEKLALTSLPEGITSIGDYTFYKCFALNSITFKGMLTQISSSAFRDCFGITVINVPWAEGAVANAPWGATNATINYNYTGA